MVIVPDTDIILIESPLKLDNYNQITFDNATSQYNYFISLNHLEYDGCTYQRKDGVIRYTTDREVDSYAPRFEDLLKYNYCMYKNDSYKDKWFYAFVTDCKYINDGLTEITIETDVFQTWQFDIIYKNSFIEREHVSNDTIGAHTLPEGLELGEYINQAVSMTEESSINFLNVTGTHKNYVCIAVTETGLGVAQPSPDYNGVFGGCTYLVFPTFADARGYIDFSDNHFSSDNKVSAFMVPYDIAIQGSGFSWETYNSGGYNFQYAFIQPTSLPTLLRNVTISKPSVLDSNYSPRNKKLLTYPYCFLNISNNSGSYANYMYEYFTNIDGSYTSNCNFIIEGSVGVGCSIKLLPLHYKYGNTALSSYAENFSEGLDAGKLPTCSWLNDTYINWLTANAVNIPLQILSGVGESVVGGVTGNAKGVTSGLSGITNTVSQVYERSLMPATAKGGVNQGDYNFGKNLTYSIYKRSIKNETAKIIDYYFDMYGYKVNELKTPNIHKRSNWDFIKCIDVNLEGNIPEKDIAKIRDLFNNGCTFWHTTSYFLDYSRTNSIL